MYVCICNALTEKQVRATVRDGAVSAASVFARLDCAPQCGKCLAMVRDMVLGHRITANDDAVTMRAAEQRSKARSGGQSRNPSSAPGY